jgi:hypothetical protein
MKTATKTVTKTATITATMTALFFSALLPIPACVTDTGEETQLDSTDVVDAEDSDLIAQAAFVGVPSNYVYAPSRGPLHDYCTKSPDEFPNPVGKNANFRGPCARHDLCLEGGTARRTCDSRLRTDLQTNCKATYGRLNPARSACLDTAVIYWAAVTANTVTK